MADRHRLQMFCGCSFPGHSRDDVRGVRVLDDVSKAVRLQQRGHQHAAGGAGGPVGHVDCRLDPAPGRRHHPHRHL